jgi:hypothetical protein
MLRSFHYPAIMMREDENVPQALQDPADHVNYRREKADSSRGSVKVVELLVRDAGEERDDVVPACKRDDERDLVE